MGFLSSVSGLGKMEVQVHLPGDSVFPVTVSLASSIAALKSSIQLSAGVPAPLQELSSHGRKLRDQDSVADCMQEVTVHISAELPLRLLVRETSGVTYQVCVRGKDSVWAVKKRVQELRGIDAQQQRLHLEKKLVENHQTVSEVYRPGKFEWELLKPTEFYLTVTTSTGNSFQVSAAQKHRVSRVVSKLREFEWFDCRHQTMRLEGKEVGSADVLSERTITGAATLVCEAPLFWLWLATLNASSHRVLINPSEPILPSLTQQLPQLQKSPMWVLHKGKVLDATVTSSGIGLASGSILQYGDLLVHIRSFNIETFDIALLSHVYIATLKQTIAKRLGRSTFKLVYCGIELSDNRTFRDCGFTSEVTIEIIEPTDRYIWVECGDEKFAQDYDVLHEFGKRYRDFDLRVYDRKLYRGVTPWNAGGGGLLQLHKSETKQVVTVEFCNTEIFIILNKADNLERLLDQLRPIGSVVAFEDIENSELVSNIGSQPLRALVENRRFIGIRSADEMVEFIPFDSSDLVITLKDRLQLYSKDVELIYNGTLLSNSNRIGEYPIQEAEYIEACKSNELMIWVHHTNDKFFITIPSAEQTLLDLYLTCRQLLSEPVLLFFGGFLPDSLEKIRDRGIGPGCCVHAILNGIFASFIGVGLEPDKFIFIQRCDGDTFLLSFSRCSTLEDVKAGLRKRFAVSIFSLVLDSRLLTTRRFSRIRCGSTVQLFTLSDGVLFRGSRSVVTPALISSTATLRTAKEMCNIPTPYKLFGKRKELSQDSQIAQVSLSGVIHYVCPKESLWTVDIENEGAMTVILTAQLNYTVRDLITAIQQAECDTYLSPRIYTSGEVCQDSNSLASFRPYSVLFPPRLLISGISQSRAKLIIFTVDSSTVGSLRTAIALKSEVDPRCLRIVYNTELLNDDAALLSTFDLTNNNRVAILREKEAAITLRHYNTLVEIVDTSTQFLRLKQIYFPFDPDEAARSQLVYNGKVVDEDATLSDYSINSIATLDIMTKAEALLKVYSNDGKCRDQIVKSDSLSLALLQSLVPSHSLHWFGEVSKSQPLADYKLGSNSVLFLVKKPRRDTCNLHFFVGSHYGRSLARIKISGNWTVKDAMEKWPNHTSKSVEAIAVAGALAGKDRRVNQCGIADGQIVYAMTDDSLLITVENELYPVSFIVANTCTGKGVKTRIGELLDIPQEVQQLYCGEFLLEDDTTVSEIATGRRAMTIALLLRPEFVTIHTVQGPVALYIPDTASTVAELKRQVQLKVPLNASRYRLFADDHELPDTDSIQTSELSTYKRLSLLTPKDIHLTVKSALCTYDLYVKKADSVLTVLRKLHRKVGVHYSRMRLLASMEVAENSDLLLTQKAKSDVLSFTAEPRDGTSNCSK